MRLNSRTSNRTGTAMAALLLVASTLNAQEPLQTYMVGPCRLQDSRLDGWRLRDGMTGYVDTGGRCGIPNDAQAVMITLVAINPTGNGHFTVYAYDDPMPLASSTNFNAGTTSSSLVMTQVSLADSERGPSFFVNTVVADYGYVDWVVDVFAYLR